MKFLTLILLIGFMNSTAFAYTTTAEGSTAAGTITTRAQARTQLAGAKTSSKITTSATVQPYDDGCGNPVPNDTGVYSACAAPIALAL